MFKQRSLRLSPRQRSSLQRLSSGRGIFTALTLILEGAQPPVGLDLPPVGKNNPHGGLHFTDEEWGKIRSALSGCPGWAALALLDEAEGELRLAQQSGNMRRITRCADSVRSAEQRVSALGGG